MVPRLTARIASLAFRDKRAGDSYNPTSMAIRDPASAKSERVSPDDQLVAETVRKKLPFAGEVSKLIRLAGDASNRRYFRVKLNGGPPHSVILMQLADPEGFKESEEAVGGRGLKIDELPFTNVLRHLARAGVSVPQLYYQDDAAGLLYLQDFGETSLADACGDAAPGDREALYRMAIDMLVRIHTTATTPANPSCVAFHRSFETSLLMWEFDHFLEYGVVSRQERPMTEGDSLAVRTEFQKIADLLAAQPRVLTHRDYHSRNLMVDEKRLGVLDFQDALLGPPTYDLASLLRDAYIELEEQLVDDLIDYYVDGIAKHRPTALPRMQFRRLFDLASIQRNLKAAGRFVYIDQVKKNPNFLADIPRTLGYVQRNLSKYPELSALRKHLARYVPELQ